MKYNPSITRRCIIAAALAASISVSQAATVLATLTSQDAILGERQDATPPSYQANSAGNRAGVSGGAGSRVNANTVIGFTLPTLNLGETIDAATFSITVTSTSSGNAFNVALFGLATTNPDVTGATLFSQSSTGAINATFTSDAAADNSTPFTSVLSFIQSYYTGGTPHIPSQSEVFFRLNQDEALALTSLDRVIFTTNTAMLSLNVIPEPSAALLGAIGFLALLRRRR